ncbi:MAG: hypothetical protein ACK5V3_00225 [Bdellovibrionales bacterium]
MTGLTLYELLYSSLDLPEGIKHTQLQKLLSEHNLNAEELTLDNLRTIVSSLLNHLILEEVEQESSFPQ